MKHKWAVTVGLLICALCAAATPETNTVSTPSPNLASNVLEELINEAKKGDADSRQRLGVCYIAGRGITRDATEGVKWLRMAAEQGNADGQYWLGLCLYNGDGVTRNYTEAHTWFSLAAAQGHSNAKKDLPDTESRMTKEQIVEAQRLAREFKPVVGVAVTNIVTVTRTMPLSPQSANTVQNSFEELKAKAEKGDAAAQCELGRCYQFGEDAPKNANEAAKWYRKAAEQENAKAQLRLGQLYAGGVGVALDAAEAAKWYRKAAEQGDAQAQFWLSQMYTRGIGVTHDAAEAVKWGRKAAERGNVEAANWLQAEAKRREQDFIKRADVIVFSKYKSKVPFRVFQSLPDGCLCSIGEYDAVLERYVFTGEIFFLIDFTSKTVADNEKLTSDLYWAGTYTYTTREHVKKTVNCYSLDRQMAQRAVRLKFGLYEKEEATTKPKSPVVEPKEAVVANDEVKSFGSGFIITKDGYLITNHHVARGAKRLRVKTEKGISEARVIAQDPQNDIALLKIEGEFTAVTFASDKVAKLGQTVFTVGFPLPELQGFSPKVTKGVVSGLSGIHDDVRMYQIDASVQPGNSGGPLADENGNIIGVVRARLSDALVMHDTGSIPQNVNYSVKKSYVIAFLDNTPGASKQIQVAADSSGASFADAVEKVRKCTVLVIVY
jgi:TPR repeat protein